MLADEAGKGRAIGVERRDDVCGRGKGRVLPFRVWMGGQPEEIEVRERWVMKVDVWMRAANNGGRFLTELRLHKLAPNQTRPHEYITICIECAYDVPDCGECETQDACRSCLEYGRVGIGDGC